MSLQRVECSWTKYFNAHCQTLFVYTRNIKINVLRRVSGVGVTDSNEGTI